MESGADMRQAIKLPPNIVVYDSARAMRGHRLNRLAVSIRDVAARDEFVANEDAYMRKVGLTRIERDMVKARDWRAMVAYGGNMYALIKIVRGLGLHQIEAGAQMRGESVEEFMMTRPVGPTGIASRDDLDPWRV